MDLDMTKKKLTWKLEIKLVGLDFAFPGVEHWELFLLFFFRPEPSASHRNDTICHKKLLQIKQNKILVVSCRLLASKTALPACFPEVLHLMIGCFS